jgi:DNA-directed RNA polymerase subunit RPC12/RpoP
MSDDTTPTITFTCTRCGFENQYTQDQITQRGMVEVMRGDAQYETYSVPCKNPKSPRCTQRRLLKVQVS